ncbi:MAG: hypothetical protein IT198_08165 [Acidimicrobiia bacterium]|nr:hypothetical protein [Acidimicrobiia bacterium]
MRRLLLPALLLTLFTLPACATTANMQLASREDDSSQSDRPSESSTAEGGLFGFGLPQGDQDGGSGTNGGSEGTDPSDPGMVDDGSGTQGSEGSGPGGFPSFGTGDLPEVDPDSEFCVQARVAMDDLSNAFNGGNTADPLAAFRQLGNTLVDLADVAPDEVKADMRRIGQQLTGINMMNFQQSQGLFESAEFANMMSYVAACGAA